ncbi:MAG: Ig-like domain-containing protein [Ornithinimicrobium sp.]
MTDRTLWPRIHRFEKETTVHHHTADRPGLSARGLVAMLATLSLLFGFGQLSSAPEAQAQETGAVDADNNPWMTHDLIAPSSGTLTVSLDWATETANLNLYVRELDADTVGPLVTRSRTAAQPEQVSFDTTTGRSYRLFVQAEEGASDYTLDTNIADGTTRDYLGTVDFDAQVTRLHDFTVDEDGLVAASLDWEGSAEVSLYLRDSDGNVVTNSRLDSNPKLLTEEVPAGEYTWLVRSDAGAAAYTLTSEQRDGGPLVPGDEHVYSDQTGYIKPNGDVKSVQTHDISAAEDGEITVILDAREEGDSPKLFVRPFNPDGSLGPAVVGSAADLPSQRVSFKADGGESYRVIVKSTTGGVDYDLTTSVDDSPFRTISGTLDADSQKARIYTVDVVEPGLLSADLSWAGDADLTMILRGPGNQLAAFSKTDANPELLTYEVPEAGAYKFQISAKSGTSDFVLATNVQTDEDRSYAGHVGFQPDTGPRSGWTNHDWTAPATGLATLQLGSDTTDDQGIYVREITDPATPNSGSLITTSRTSVTPEQASFEVTEGSTYRLYVSTEAAGGSFYTLDVAVQTDPLARTYLGTADVTSENVRQYPLSLDSSGEFQAELSWEGAAELSALIVDGGEVVAQSAPATSPSTLEWTAEAAGDYQLIVQSTDGAAAFSMDTTFDPDVVAAACSPISTLACGDVLLDTPVELAFDGTEGGLVDKDGEDIGFTMVDDPSSRLASDGDPSNPDVPGYEPSLLDVDGGTLTIDATPGIQYANPGQSSDTNTQINGLGVGVDATEGTTTVTTTMVAPDFDGSANSEKSGLWFGLDEDNLVNISVQNQAGTNLRVQLQREVNGAVVGNDDEINGPTFPEGMDVELTLVLDESAGTAVGSYQIGTGEVVQVGTLDIPAAFFQGETLSDDETGPASFAGVYATTRRDTANPLAISFSDFDVTNEVNQGGAPVVNLTGNRTLFEGQEAIIPVAVSDPDDDEVAVTVDGLPDGLAYADGSIDGTLAQDTLADSPYTVSISADDGNGNVTEASFDITVIDDVALDVNFQSVAAPTPDGYLADSGQAYGDRGDGLSYGWIEEGGNTPLDMSSNGRDRDRGGIDQLLDTFIHMQYGDIGTVFDGNPNCTANQCDPGAWEIDLPNGLYEVTLAVGDQPSGDGYDSLHAINLEAGVAIESFQGTGAQEYLEATAYAGVDDGKLTINAIGGANSKLNYVQIRSVGNQPLVTAVLPENRSNEAALDTSISASVNVPGNGVGVDPDRDTSLTDEAVKLFEVTEGGDVEVAGNRGSTGGNDTIAISPEEELKAETTYRYVIDGVLDEAGNTFERFESLFTTGEGGIDPPPPPPGECTEDPIPEDCIPAPIEDVDFEKELQDSASGANGKFFASLEVHEGYLWATTIGQGTYRYEIGADGSLGAEEDLGVLNGRAAVGFKFDADNPDLAWVTHATGNIGGEDAKIGSKLSTIDFSDVANPVVTDVFVNLPRSKKDHLSNSIAYGPTGDGGDDWLYFLQGSNQAAGDVDGSWGTRGETQLTAALLRFDPQDVLAEATANGPIDVATEEVGGSYDPFADGAPLEIYATGIRNAYDLVWHSNGSIYVPTNGTAGGGNSPGVDIAPDGTATMVSNQTPGENGFGDGTDVTEICENRRIDGQPYTGGSVPAVSSHPTQLDFMFEVEEGGYYGHPNPTRCEWVLNNGSDSPSNTGQKYPAGTDADPNYKGFAYNFDFNKSPNGVIEYQSDTYGGQLQGRVMVIRFSGNDDILTMQVANNGDVVLAQGGDEIGGFNGYVDPLELTEDTEVNPGNLYVNQYNRGGEPQQLYLLRATEAPSGAIVVDSEKEVFSATLNNEQPTDTEDVTISNNGDESATVTAEITGDDAGQFSVTDPGAIAAGEDTDVTVTFDPSGSVGIRNATLEVTSGDTTESVTLRALAFAGQEGGEEPPLQLVADALELDITTGWSGLADGTGAAAKGSEVLEPLFERASDAPVTMTPVAAFAPQENLPFGWYADADGDVTTNEVGSIANGQLQTLNPTLGSGDTSFDPGEDAFGLYYFSNTFNRTGFTEDARNDGGGTHRARIYPLSGDRFLVAFEDASNGDYQDYVFILGNVVAADDAPPPPPPGDEVSVNFQSEDASVPDGYLRDFGEAYGVRTGADQGTDLSYGWVDTDDGSPLSLVGNGRDRGSNDDQLLDTLMHMDLPPEGQGGVLRDGSWELAIADGTYDVTVSVGDPDNGGAAESHTINVEGTNAIDGFPKSSAANGSDERHQQATVTVDVADGKLTVDQSGGTNTKINYIEIEETDVVDPPPAEGQVNFQAAGAATPADWAADTGELFDTDRGYGWVDTKGGADKTGDVRTRDTDPDVLNDTFVIMDDAVVAANVNGDWEYTLEDGEYAVEVSVGEPDFDDSTHGVSAEGVSVIDGFVPSAPGDYETGSANVEVTDGALTVTSTGENTKLQWIKITELDEDVVAPKVAIELDGDGSDGFYTGPVTVTVTATDRTLEFTDYTVDGGTTTNYTEPFEVSGNGAHEVVVTATDGAGNETVETVNFTIAALGAGDLELTNPEAAPFNDRLVMSRIQSGTGSPLTSETATVVLSNEGTEAIEVSALDIADTDDFQVNDAPTLPAAIAVGEELEVEVQFIGTGTGSNTNFESAMVVRHNGSDGPATTVELGAIWQSVKEGGNEPNVAEIVEAYGVGTTIVGPGEQINNQGRLESIGDEVLSQTWERADDTQPMTVRQLGAYHSCCNNTAAFGWHPVGNKGNWTQVVRHDGQWAQTLLPRINGSDVNPAFASFTPGPDAFSWRIDPESSDWTLNDDGPDQCGAGNDGCQLGHHLRVWPAEDRDGVAIEGTYIVVMDYAGINYDFNDNVYLVTNAAPAGN